MTTAEFLTYLRTLDIKIWAEGEQLRFNAPKGVLTPELKTMLQQKKPEILAFLHLGKRVKPLKSVSRNQAIPLSHGQQRLWFVQQLQPESAAYNIPRVTRLQGGLNIGALEQAFQTVIQRHDSLRTHFTFIEGQLSQQIAPPETAMQFTLPHISCSLAEAETEIAAIAWQPFDLATDPLLRVNLYHVGADDYLLFINFHHIIFDGWSFNIFNRELALSYEAACQQRLPALPPHPLDYADFAVWERTHVEETEADHLPYWQTQLAGELPDLQLPTDFHRPAVQQFNGQTYPFTISTDLTHELEKFAASQHCTMFMLMMTAFKVLLHRYSGQTDILVGYPYANREQPELQTMLGFFINTLVLRTDLANNPTAIDLLAQVRQRTLAAENHQSIPFNKVARIAQPKPDLSRQPIFQVMFAWQNLPPMALTLPGLKTTPFPLENRIAKFDLTLEMMPDEGGMVSGWWEYNTDIFTQQTIQRMSAHFEAVLRGIVAQPTSPIDRLPLLSEAELHQQLITWNETGAEYPHQQIFAERLAEQVAQNPQGTAVIWFEGDTRHELTYQTLFERANQLAHYLQQQGVAPDSLVAICAHRTPDMVVGLVGILQAGAAYLPLDPAYPTERLAFMLSDSQATILLTQEALLKVVPTTLPVFTLDSAWPTIATQPTTPPPNHSTPDNLAYIIYTSGSTGKPKGVMIRQQGLLNYLQWATDTYPYTEGCGTPVHSSISFDLTITSLFAPLYVGQPLILIPADDTFGELLSHLPQTLGPYSVVKITPAHLTLLEQQLSPKQAAQWAKGIVVGGEALWRDNVAFWQTHAPETMFVNEYGPTETVVGCCVYTVPPEPLTRVSVPIGRPIANTQLYILDEYLQPVPVGVIGQLFIGGDGVARGYLNRHDLTAMRFIPNPFGEGRLYRTGDLARYLPDGTLDFLGRIDHQVKVRGYRIELGEIETLLTLHSAVNQAAVIARNQRLLAYVVMAASEVSTQQLQDYLATHLPDYMLPNHITILESLPLTPNGKVDRDALPTPHTGRAELSVHYVPPRNSVEEFLAHLWADVLVRDKVGVHDDFFELGGHSLQVAQIVFEIKRLFSVELTMRELFAQLTVARLAQLIQAYRKNISLDETNLSSTLDLLAEATLPDDIQLSHPFSGSPERLESIFLTGGSGYLGAFILRDLLAHTTATIYCLVRATDAAEGKQRLQNNMESYLLWDDGWAERIVPVIGNLTEPRFGLSEADYTELAQISQQIYHAGAAVNLVYPYQLLHGSNVLGVLEILRFATYARTIPIHHISTIAVFASTAYFQGGTIYEDDPLLNHEGHFNGYCQSKWVSDRLLMTARERGIPISIYRPAVVGGDSETGAAHAGDYFFKYLKGCIQLGAMPDLGGRWYITPINFISRAIVELSCQSATLGQTFHVMTDHYYTTAELITLLNELNYPIKRLTDFGAWRQLLVDYIRQNDDHELYPLLSLYLEGVTSTETATLVEMYAAGREPTYDRQNLVQALPETLTCPVVDQTMLDKYIQFFVESGFMPSTKEV